MDKRRPEHAPVELSLHGDAPSAGASVAGYLAVVVLSLACAAAIGYFHSNKSCPASHPGDCVVESEGKS